MAKFFSPKSIEKYDCSLRAIILPIIFLIAGIVLVLTLHRYDEKSIGNNIPNGFLGLSTSALTNIKAITIEAEGIKTSLSKRSDGWRLDAQDYPVKEGMVNSLLYKLSSLKVSQKLNYDDEGLYEIGLMEDRPTEDTIIVSLYLDDKVISKVILGKIFHPQIGENAKNQWILGGNKNSFRAVSVINSMNQKNTFLTPANGANLTVSTKDWLKKFAVPWSNKIISISFSFLDETVRVFERNKILGAFLDVQSGQKIPDEYSMVLSDMLNPGIVKLYETNSKNGKAVELSQDKIIVTIITLDNLKYTVQIVGNYTFDQKSNKGDNAPVVQFISVSDKLPDSYALASFSIENLGDKHGTINFSEDEIVRINTLNKDRTFVVGFDELSKFIKKSDYSLIKIRKALASH